MPRKSIAKITYILIPIIIMGCYSIVMACKYSLCRSSGFGELQTATITLSRQIHSYSFHANKGDRVLIRMNRIGGTINPRIEVFSSNGMRLTAAGIGFSFAETWETYIPNDGSYGILCSDYYGTGLGAYSLNIQRSNDPVGAREIDFDEIILDSLVEFSQMEVYKFYAYAGESIIAQMLREDNTYTPRLELFHPNGIRMATSVDEFEAVIIKESLPDEGYYSLIASDDESNGLGKYTLLLHRLPVAAGDDNDVRPAKFSLEQNYPNPFNPSTMIDYTIPEFSFVTLDIFNILGEKIRTLISRDLAAGQYSIAWDGNDESGQETASGIYYYRIVAGDFTETKKMILLR